MGQPVVVRQVSHVTGLASLSGAPDACVPLPQPITVRIYLSSSTGSATSADTAVPAGGDGEAARLRARLRALDQMSRRVAQAQQTIVKGVPAPLPAAQAGGR